MTEQVVQPRIRGFIATNAHPDGCAANVREQLDVVRAGLPGSSGSGLTNALVIGSSTGYGFASTLCACFGRDAKTLGICFERPPVDERTGSAGWYNLAEAHRLAREQGRTLETINGDAFSRDIKRLAIEALRSRFGRLDLLIYSLAAPRREDPDSDTVWSSVLKPIGAPYAGKALDLRSEQVVERSIDPASKQEIEDTVRVMGGEDWASWVEALREADLLADGFRTVAFSYVGPELTYAIYRAGTIGRAKHHLEATARELTATLAAGCGGEALVSVNKAVVTQASAAIPAVSLYVSILIKVMKQRGLEEGPVEQMVRLFRDYLTRDPGAPGAASTVDGMDEEGRIRLDDLELAPEVQAEVAALWERVTTENLDELSDFAAYRQYFRRLFGFEVEGIDYDAPTELQRELL